MVKARLRSPQLSMSRVLSRVSLSLANTICNFSLIPGLSRMNWGTGTVHETTQCPLSVVHDKLATLWEWKAHYAQSLARDLCNRHYSGTTG